MTSFTAESTGKMLFLNLKKGDDLYEGIVQGVKDAGIETGVIVSGIGTLDKFRYHYINDTNDTPTDIIEVIEGPLEVAVFQGIILEGKPHIHIVASVHGTKNYSGHLHEGSTVLYLAEVAIMECKKIPLGRRPGAFGINQFEMLD